MLPIIFAIGDQIMRFIWRRGLALVLLLALGQAAWAAGEMMPAGNPTLNQARQARLLVKSDATVFKPTRGLFIGDATACDVALMFAGDSAAVTFPNVQSGATYPFQVKQLLSTGTTCVTVIALY